jgi:hypothetical protein
MSNKGLQGRILELEDTIQQLHELNKRLEDDIKEADRWTDKMRQKLKDANVYPR